jgi:Fe2+ transport system protein FeoA
MARITGYVKGNAVILQRLMEMGLIRGTEIKVIRFAPLGDPMEIFIRGYQLSLRLSEAALVEVEIM